MKKAKRLLGRLSRPPRRRDPPGTPALPLVPVADQIHSLTSSGTRDQSLGEERITHLTPKSPTSAPRAVDEGPSQLVVDIQSTTETPNTSEQDRLPRSNTSDSAPNKNSDSELLDTNGMQPPVPSPVLLTPSDKCDSRSGSELQKAIHEFKHNYRLFAQKNKQYIILDEALDKAFQISFETADIRDTAEVFRKHVWKTLETMETRKEKLVNKWTTKVGQFVTKLYPVARLASGLTAATAEGAMFMPLKGAATGLGIILQLLEEESGRCDDFLYHLRRIEYLAALVADPPNGNFGPETSVGILQEKSTDLICAVIRFFNSALLYLGSGSFVNLSKSVWKGPGVYAQGKDQLEVAIRDYDLAVMHLIAKIVASKNLMKTKADLATNYKQGIHTKGQLLLWLSPSYWSVESYLHSFRHQRAEGTLNWARDLSEFREWRLSGLDKDSSHRITWVHGTLGIGKSIMAAYYIDLLKCQYPNAIVAYFFCRSKEPGLFTPRDILRALAYQCMEKMSTACVALEELKSHGFQISDDLGIGYLFEKLLLGPMQKNEKEIFIVLDGLDEADTECHDRFGRPELHILLNCLSELPSTRLLCISRPSADISNVLRNTFSKPLQKEDTEADIDSYVTKTVKGSLTLQKQFGETQKDPVVYFREKGCGIFLWVVLVLQQLEKTRSQREFLMCLDGFSTATGSMENLYFAVLSGVVDQGKMWVREIIRWVIFAERPLIVFDLQDIVEECLQDKFVNLQRFLEVECGSFLSIRGISKEVHVVHETFRSFILNQEKCQPEFLLDEGDTHEYIVLKCLQCLLKGSNTTYATRYWVDHLAKAKSPQHTSVLLSALWRFFASKRLVTWVRLLCDGSTEVEPSVNKILDWLRDHNTVDKGCNKLTTAREDGEVLEMFWGDVNGDFIGQEVGKAACRLWAYEEKMSRRMLEYCFNLALEYYRKRPQRTQTNLVELRQLISTGFQGLLDWSGKHHSRIVKRNLGLGYFAVYSWEKSIQCWEIEDLSKHDDFLAYFLLALFYRQEYEQLVHLVTRGLSLAPATIEVNLLLSELLQSGSGKSFLDPLLDYILQDPNFRFSRIYWTQLERALLKRGAPDSTIIVLEKSKVGFIDYHAEHYWHHLYTAYKRERGDVATIHRFQEAVEANAECEYTWTCLADAYMDIGEHDNAIQLLQSGLATFKDSYNLENSLTRAELAKGNYDEVITTLKARYERGSCWPAELFIQAYEMKENKKGNKDGKILALKEIIFLDPSSSSACIKLAQAYLDEGDIDQSIKVLDATLESINPRYDIRVDDIYYAMFNMYKQVGQYVKALDVLKSYQNQSSLLFMESWEWRLLDVYVLMRDYIGAIAAFETIVSQPDLNADWGWRGLFTAMAMNGAYDEAINRFETAIDNGQLKCSIALGYTMLGIYGARGDYDRAIKRFEALVNLSPLDLWLWHILGDIYCARGSEKEAIELYRCAHEIDSGDYSFHFRLCSLYYVMSDYQNAIEWYKIVRQMAPESVLWEYIQFDCGFYPYKENIVEIDERVLQSFLWYPAARAYEGLGFTDKAIDVYREVLAHYEIVIEEKDTLNIARYGRNGFERFSNPFDVFPEKPRVRCRSVLCYLIGELYRAMKDFDKSLAALEEALVSEPNNTWLQTVIQETQTMLDAHGDNTDNATRADTNETAEPVESSLPLQRQRASDITEEGVYV